MQQINKQQTNHAKHKENSMKQTKFTTTNYIINNQTSNIQIKTNYAKLTMQQTNYTTNKLCNNQTN